MNDFKHPALNRIPGALMPVAQREVHVKDLTKLSQLELLDIKAREAKLLTNKAKLARLPDKGKRIKDFYDKVLAELERRSNVDTTLALFSELNIAEKGEKALNELEWQGKLDVNGKIPSADPTEDVLDSDDELEMDPLKIIAQKTMHERKTVQLPPEKPLITEQDLEEIKAMQAENSRDSGVFDASVESHSPEPVVNAEVVAIDVSEKLPKLKEKLKKDVPAFPAAKSDLEQHVLYVVEKTEINQNKAHEKRVKFLPHRTTKTNVHAPEKERERKLAKNWESTAATPPPIQHNGTQMLTLLDSVQIQTEYLARLRECHEKQAMERLLAKAERLQLRNIQLPAEEELQTLPAFTKYRDTQQHIEGVQQFNEDDEVHDTLDDVKPSAGITYTVYE